MGTFSGLAAGRFHQLLYSGVKVPLLMLVTFGLCLPSFFVLNTVAGLRDEKIDAYHVGFVLGPRLNACGRMGHEHTQALQTDGRGHVVALFDNHRESAERLRGELAAAERTWQYQPFGRGIRGLRRS